MFPIRKKPRGPGMDGDEERGRNSERHFGTVPEWASRSQKKKHKSKYGVGQF